MLRILIVENDVLLAKELMRTLQSYKVEVLSIARSAKEAICIIDTSQPDFVLLDIELDDESSGIEVANYINKGEKIPFIYLTDYIGSSNKYYKIAQDTEPSNYLPKGTFLFSQLWHFIETAMDNFSRKQQPQIDELKDSFCFIRHCFFVRNREDYTYVKIGMNDIHYLEVAKPYVKIYTINGKLFTAKISLDTMLKLFSTSLLLRISQRHAVHINSIKAFTISNYEVVLKDDKKIDIGRAYLKSFKDKVLLVG